MSFYLGKDSGGVNNILHLTSNTHTATEMKTSIFDDTIFHSSLKYLEYSVDTLNIYNSSVIYPSNDTIDKINNSGLCFFFVINGVLQPAIKTLFSASRKEPARVLFHPTPTYIYDVYPTPSYTNKYIITSGYASITSAYLIFVNINNVGTYINNTSHNPALGITLNSTSVLVNNINLLNYKYLSIGDINTIDTTISVPGSSTKLQLINSINNATSMKVDSLNRTIYKGTHPIFTYSNASNKYMYSSTLTYTTPVYNEYFASPMGTVTTVTNVTNLQLPLGRFSIFIITGSSGQLSQYTNWMLPNPFLLYPDGSTTVSIIGSHDYAYSVFINTSGYLCIKTYNTGSDFYFNMNTDSYTFKVITFK